MKSQFSAFVKSSAGGPVVVTRNGKPVAVLIGVQDEEEIERLLMAYSPRLRAILDSSRRQIADGKGIGHEEFWAEIEAGNAPRRNKSATKSARPNKKMQPTDNRPVKLKRAGSSSGGRLPAADF